MEQQEYFMRVQMLGQEAERIEQQIQVIEQQIAELSAVKESIKAIETGDEKKEILANLGKGIFVKADLKNKELFINVGKDVIIKKTPEETIKVIEKETQRMMEGKSAMIARIQEIQENMQELMKEMQSQSNSSEHHHSCENEDCMCEDPCEDCECEKKGKKK